MLYRGAFYLSILNCFYFIICLESVMNYLFSKIPCLFSSQVQLTPTCGCFFQVPGPWCSCSMACWQIPVTGSQTCPIAAWASSQQMPGLMCGWGTAEETPGLGTTELFLFLKINSGPSGRFELMMTGFCFLSTLNIDIWGSRQMSNLRLYERETDAYVLKLVRNLITHIKL